jgi:hypothetical protein
MHKALRKVFLDPSRLFARLANSFLEVGGDSNLQLANVVNSGFRCSFGNAITQAVSSEPIAQPPGA